MIAYKNVGYTEKTFYGVTFKPGDIKEVPGHINHYKFVQVNSVPQEPPKRAVKKKSNVQIITEPEEIKEGGEIDGTDSDK